MGLFIRCFLFAVLPSLLYGGANCPTRYERLGENSEIVQAINNLAVKQILTKVESEMKPFSTKITTLSNQCNTAITAAKDACEECMRNYANDYHKVACYYVLDKIKELARSLKKKTKQFVKGIKKTIKHIGKFGSRLVRRFGRLTRRLIRTRFRTRLRIRLPKPRVRLPRLRLPRIRFRRFRYRLPRFRFRYRAPRYRFRFRRWGKKKRDLLRSERGCSPNCKSCDLLDDSKYSNEQIQINVCGPHLKQEEELFSRLQAIGLSIEKDAKNGISTIQSVDYDQLNIKKENVFDLNCVVYQINGKCVTFKSNTPLYLNNEEGITRTGGSIGDQILAKLRESQYRVP